MIPLQRVLQKVENKKKKKKKIGEWNEILSIE